MSKVSTLALLAALALSAADKPKDLSKDEKLEIAAATIEMQAAKDQAQAAQLKLQPYFIAAEQARQKYEALVERYQSEKGATGCQLDTNQEWVNCKEEAQGDESAAEKGTASGPAQPSQR